MTIREQAFDAIVSNHELWKAWNNCHDEWGRANMLIEQAYILGTKQAEQVTK